MAQGTSAGRGCYLPNAMRPYQIQAWSVEQRDFENQTGVWDLGLSLRDTDTQGPEGTRWKSCHCQKGLPRRGHPLRQEAGPSLCFKGLHC